MLAATFGKEAVTGGNRRGGYYNGGNVTQLPVTKETVIKCFRGFLCVSSSQDIFIDNGG